MMEFEPLIPQGLDSDLPPDLDLIEVLWRQDVDLGVGKEVFDPNLRRELELERQLEQRKEQEKRKEVEKRAREKQQEAHQWLTQNFVRDGETGEWVPISGAGNSASFSPSGPSSFYPQPPPDQPLLNLEEALSFVEEHETNHSYGLQQQQQQQQVVAPVLLSNHSLPADVTGGFQFNADDLLDETQISNYTLHNQTDSEGLEDTWQEVVSFLTDNSLTTTTTTNNNNSGTTNATMPPVDTEYLVPSVPDIANQSAPLLLQQLQQQQYQQQQQQPLNANHNISLMLEPNQSMSSATSMNETQRLLRQNSTAAELGNLTGLLGEAGMVLQNVTLPMPALDAGLATLMDFKPLANETGVASQDYNSTNPAHNTLSPLDWEGEELFLPSNLTDLGNLTNAITASSMLDADDILTGILPAEMESLENLDNLQMLDDGSSDSAISMGSGSPQQEVNETMEMQSPFDGLEGATGGTDYDSTNYGRHRSQTRSSGNSEDDGFNYSCSSYGSPASVNTNCSTGSNDTEHSGSQSSASVNHIHHNHTYNTQPGQTPREVKKYAKRDGPRQKGPQSRDVKRLEELKLPFSFERIVESPVEEFNDMLTKTKLTEAQMSLMRDIRRRGKNKVAAQNCRKRKLDVIVTLEDTMSEMQRARDKLAEERRQIDLQTRQAKEKYAALYDHIFNSLRDEQGRPYNPAEFSLQQSSDGNVFLVRMGNSSSPASSVVTSSSPPSPTSSSSSTTGSKRKDYSQQKKKSKE